MMAVAEVSLKIIRTTRVGLPQKWLWKINVPTSSMGPSECLRNDCITIWIGETNTKQVIYQPESKLAEGGVHCKRTSGQNSVLFLESLHRLAACG